MVSSLVSLFRIARLPLTDISQKAEGFGVAPSIGRSIIDLSSVTTVGLDLAKHVFQAHGVDASVL
jgi:hypothetical protein